MADANTNIPAANPDKEVNELIRKYRPEIDAVKDMDSKSQQQVFRDLGIDPAAIENHYSELEGRARQLRREDDAAATKTMALGLTSLAAATAGAYAVTARKLPLGSRIVRGFAVPIAGIFAGIAGTYMGSRIFSGKIRSESAKMGYEAKDAFERELAIALENKAREAEALEKASFAANAPQRDTSFAAQASADKAAAESLPPQRG